MKNRKGESFIVYFRNKYYDGDVRINDSITLIRKKISTEGDFMKVITPMQLGKSKDVRGGKFDAYYKFNMEYNMFEHIKHNRNYSNE